MQTAPTQLFGDLGPAGHREQHQAGEPGAPPEMGLPEGALEGIVAQAIDLALQTEGDHARPTEQGETGSIGGAFSAPKQHQGQDRAQQYEENQPKAGQAPGEGGQGVGREDHHGQREEHDGHHSRRQPAAQIGVVPPHGGRQFGFIDAAIAGLQGQAQHHAEQGIHHRHRQYGVEQPKPVDGLQHRLIDERTSPGLRRGTGLAGLKCSCHFQLPPQAERQPMEKRQLKGVSLAPQPLRTSTAPRPWWR